MKPAWDKLMKKYRKSKTGLVADVDCTADGKPLCDANGVKGFPTIKWGDPNNLENYEGGREYKDLEKFAKKNLKPVCSAKNLDLCKGKKKEMIEGFLAMELEVLEGMIQKHDDVIAEAEADFEEGQKRLQQEYQQLQADKEEKIQKVKDSGLGLMKSAVAFRKQEAGKTEL